MIKGALGRVVISVLLSVLVLAGAIGLGLFRWSEVATPVNSVASAAVVQSPSAQAAPSAQEFAGAIRQVVERVRPAVVQITSRAVPISGFSGATPETGVGSGVIYDPAGFILTNFHVIEGAQSLTVALPDGRSFQGRLVGGDEYTDLAVVKIDGDNLPVAPLGDSDQMMVGDWVVAIGNALALSGGPTVTAGVVSAKGRSVQEPGTTQGGGPFLYDLIQTDASINPGNSGGALVNLNGEVVGINTLVAGGTGSGYQAQGIGFAISTNTARPIAEELQAGGRVSHAYLGISYAALTPSIARQLGVQDGDGAVIGAVDQNSPAARAGLQRLDIIRQADGQAMVDESSLGRVLRTKRPGDTLSLTVERNGQTNQVQVTLGERP